MFDINEDKKIDRDDIFKILPMLFGSKLTEEDMDTLVAKIFDEVLQQNSEKTYLDHDDITKILYSTNIN